MVDRSTGSVSSSSWSGSWRACSRASTPPSSRPRPRFVAYPVLTHIAEKLHAYTLPRPRPNSRVKDLPDIALLAGSAAIEATELVAAIEATFANRGTHPVPSTFSDPPEAWAPVYTRMASEEGLDWADLAQLVGAVPSFVDPVLAGRRGVWDPAKWTWSDRDG
ncbi:MAG: nucleotidyl transferase AbiEii/AbiGii toxin family protein [Pseudomonadota bacterium]|nr:nucleotidyl transferase AbiEii/AbiGii toxin family protein [Pseudomonadota bacterium]